MIIRKPSLLFASYSSFTSLPPTISGSTTSSLKRKRERTRPCQHCQHGTRRYATIADDSSHSTRNDEHLHHSWPDPPAGQSCPTPYQIFRMNHNAVYTKARFYQLVKVYHPDRDSVANSEVSKAVKMERYRLIIAANDILSSPDKRSAYDRFGAGWNGKAGIRRSEEHAGPFSQNWQHTSGPQDPIWQNATWEDWERFYHARARARGEADGVHQQNRAGLYLSNSSFVLLVFVLAMIGSTANFSRAQTEGHYLVDQRDIIHDKTAKELRRVKQEALANGTKNDRLQWWLRNREASMGLPGSDIETLREEKVDRLLPNREVCRSEGISESN